MWIEATSQASQLTLEFHVLRAAFIGVVEDLGRKHQVIGRFLRHGTFPRTEVISMDRACISVESVHLPSNCAFHFYRSIMNGREAAVPLKTTTVINKNVYEHTCVVKITTT